MIASVKDSSLFSAKELLSLLALKALCHAIKADCLLMTCAINENGRGEQLNNFACIRVPIACSVS